MATFKKIVDSIAKSVNSGNKDQRIPKRQILFVLQSNLEFLISQKLNDKSLFREDGVYTEIPCVPFECVDTYTCDIVEFRSCNKVSKGTKKLPNIINSRFGPAIRSFTNIDGTKKYRFSTPNDYRRNKLREEKLDSQNYYIKEGVPYLPDTCMERANIEILTLEPYLISEISECHKDKCKSYWDYEMPTSDKITNVARQQTINELLQGLQNPTDENTDMNSNIKTGKIA